MNFLPDTPLDEVNRHLLTLIPPPHPPESIATHQAAGRVLAENIMSPIDVPGHDNSAMDGYAFDWDALPNPIPAEITLHVIGTLLAGHEIPQNEERVGGGGGGGGGLYQNHDRRTHAIMG